METFLLSNKSPYKHRLTKIKQVDLKIDDSDDFQSPNIKSKTCPKQSMGNKKKTSNTKSIYKTNENLIAKTIRDNFQTSDVNPENLQMVLALSKSTFESENPNNQIIDEYSQDVLNAPNKFRGNVLQKFGFKSEKSKLSSVLPKTNFFREPSSIELSKKRKFSKFRHVTPTLLTRTDEDREALITRKMSYILHYIDNKEKVQTNQLRYRINSTQIKQYFVLESKLISLNSKTLDDLQEDLYTVKALNFPFTPSCCGCLLRRWEDIPGRDKSPQHTGDSEAMNSKTESKFSSTKSRCISPDLFESSSEESNEDIENDTNTTGVINKSKVLTKLYRSDSGIEHFEYVCENPEVVSEHSELEKIMLQTSNESLDHLAEVCDLTNSDNENEDFFSLRSKDDSLSDNNETKATKNVLEYTISPVVITNDVTLDGVSMNSTSVKENNTKISINKLSEYDCSLEENILIENQFDNSEEFNMTIKVESCRARTTKCQHLTSDNVVDLRDDDDNEPIDINKSSTKEVSYRISMDKTNNLNVTDYVNELLNKRNSVKFATTDESKETILEEGIADNLENLSQSSTVSQESILISDEELNYSSMKSSEMKTDNLYELHSDDEEELEAIEFTDMNDVHLNLRAKYCQNDFQQDLIEDCTGTKIQDVAVSPILSASPILDKLKNRSQISRDKIGDEQNSPSRHAGTSVTNLIVKTNNVTPMANYDEMDSPQICAELDKIGVKPLKRRRGVQLLKYIYEYTHPVLSQKEISELVGNGRSVKRRKTDHVHSSNLEQSRDNVKMNVDSDRFLQNEKLEDFIFESRTSRKVWSCAVPLQIIWYNFIINNPELHKSILLYEPIQLEVIHSMLKEQSGCKFKLEDLINFLDKKCITFRTSQWQKQTKKH